MARWQVVACLLLALFLPVILLFEYEIGRWVLTGHPTQCEQDAAALAKSAGFDAIGFLEYCREEKEW